ncbi:hypothetical protein [Stenotrophomonas sp.]|uniref:hypothetical protein n=1 Tax=Stenotrophomonas sp. TaxID=69392 RepID=UPI00289BEA53|nr:hypothetical protein [Stenotrophomonas sp.]
MISKPLPTAFTDAAKVRKHGRTALAAPRSILEMGHRPLPTSANGRPCHDAELKVTKALPSRLPPPFHWVEEQDRKHLFLGSTKVLEICKRNRGWIVHIFLQDPERPQPIVAVGSANAGMRWGANWAKLRVRLLSSLAAAKDDHTPTTPS